MKKYCTLFICSLLFAAFSSTSFGEGTLHTFTTPDGRTLNAAIKGHNSSNGKIQIEREDGKKLWTRPTVFSEADQQYINQWIAADQFMSSIKFKIEGKKKKNTIPMHIPSFASHASMHESRIEIEYEITLENKTDFPLKDLKIEYRAFILNQSHEGKEDSNRVDGGELHIYEIPAGGKISKKVQATSLSTNFKIIWEKSFSGSLSKSQIKTSKEQLKGFWLKVYGPEIDGNAAIRNWCNPPNTIENYAWQKYTSLSPATRPEQIRRKESELLWEALHLKSDDPQKALEIYHEAYEIAQSPKVAFEIGSLHLNRLNPPNIQLGLEWMEKAASNNYVIACASLADIYASYRHPEYHDVKKALKHGLKAISIRPKAHWVHRAMAGAYAEDGQFAKAVKHQERSIKLFIRCLKHDKAYLKKTLPTRELELTLYKDNKSKYNKSNSNVLQAPIQSGPAKAIKLLKEAYERNPTPYKARDIGYTYIWKLKPPNIPLGLEWLGKAAKENNVAACRLLSSVYSSCGEYYNLEKTLEYGRKALSIETDCYTSHASIAKAYAIDGQFDKAVEHQQKAIKLFKKSRNAKPKHMADMEATLERYRNK